MSEGSKLSAARLAAKARKRVYDKNRRFRAMTKAQKRVAIAKDVLELLDSKKIVAQRGIYLGIDINKTTAALVKPHETVLRDLLPIPSVQCQVCAIGSVFTAMVLNRGIDGDEVAVRPTSYYSNKPLFKPIYRDDMADELKICFSEAQLRKMEGFFEDDNDVDDDDQLRTVMEHIIKTKGSSVAPAFEQSDED